MFENEYFFIRKPKGRPDLPYLNPDLDTSKRNYDFEALPLGQAPLRFYNENRQQNRIDGVTSMTPNILFEGFNLVVRDKIRERLLDLDVPHVHLYPSIYIDNEERWNEDYWYLTFTREFDCWDRELSDYERSDPPVELGGAKYHQVYSYRFQPELMKRTPLEQRLLFKMGGSLDAFIVAHESIIGKVFGRPSENGADYIRVSDF